MIFKLLKALMFAFLILGMIFFALIILDPNQEIWLKILAVSGIAYLIGMMLAVWHVDI